MDWLRLEKVQLSPDLFAWDMDGCQAAVFIYFCSFPKIILPTKGTCNLPARRGQEIRFAFSEVTSVGEGLIVDADGNHQKGKM